MATNDLFTKDRFNVFTIPGRRYQPNRNKVVQLIAAGLIATTAMTLVGYFAPLVGLVGIDFALVYGAILNSQVYPETFTGLWWAGLAWHFINGAILFPLLFDFLADKKILINERFIKGTAWGLALWAIFEALVEPMAGDGFFSRNTVAPVQIAILGLVAWLAYGWILEAMTRVRLAATVTETDYRREAA